ncbi:protein-disulfide reductase DsbD [Methylotenera sp.]|uniref:protein-disulfide reductase DsbD n=1 Tax=Methylotenera sp. TaxID=2051956 RepID=UPI00271A2058|nr:protein-disulfide reductase DsbD [Methylotenera sp.]MDO9203878.1 protein-disulfide reductase DsbD [Methylotenera sp.]MDP1522953.1 protein-disulfide reductase DsbD [Methylotenera sp.]MDP3817984.1 protein-disulfide reductase DsbD [Methylotenera sp.]
MKNTFLKNLACSLFAVVTFGFLTHVHAGEAKQSTIANALFDSSDNEYLSPDAAFKLELSAIDAQNIKANFTVAPGYYLYRERIKLVVQSPALVKVSELTLPAGEIKEDPNFGKQEVYHHDFNANIKLNTANNNQVVIDASYQGCSEKGLCYAPIKKSFTVDLTAINNQENVNAAPVIASDNDTDATMQVLKSGNLWLVIAGFFVAGLLLSLTPCVLPMIPILSSIIVGSQSKQVRPSRLHAFGLSVAYVLGMALSYTLAGIAAGLSGDLISQSLQNAWVLGATAFIFILLAFSMFGFYELKLPQSFEDKMLNTSNKLKGGQFLGVFVMGALSALIVSPCVAAPLAGALIYIGQTHNVLLGGVGLFALAIGMGMPLLLIGASAGSLLPKTGNWMNAVRNFFGVLMLGMAIWLISPIIPVSIQLALWAILLIVTAVYHNALDNLPAHASNYAKLWKGVAVIVLIFGVALLIGALSGSKSALQPLNNFSIASGNQSKNTPSLAFTRIASIAELEKKLAETNGQPVMLDFYADWCVACKELEDLTFSDPKVQQQLRNTMLLQVDVTANTDEDKALLKRFGLYGPPGIAFFNGHGQEMTTLKTVGFQNADRFSATLSKRDSCIVAPKSSEDSTVQC